MAKLDLYNFFVGFLTAFVCDRKKAEVYLCLPVDTITTIGVMVSTHSQCL